MFPLQPRRLEEACSSKTYGSRGQKCQTTPRQTSKYIPAVTTSGVSNWDAFCGVEEQKEEKEEEEEEGGSGLKAPNHIAEPCGSAALVLGCFILMFCVSKLTSDLSGFKCFCRPSARQQHSSPGAAASVCFFFSPLSLPSRVSVTLPAHCALLSCNGGIPK